MEKHVRGIGARGQTIEVPLESIVSRLFVEITYEQIASGWVEWGASSVPLDKVKSGDIIRTVWEDTNTLDNDVSLQHIAIYTIGADSEDVLNNAPQYDGAIGLKVNENEHGYGNTNGTVCAVAKPGNQIWVSFDGIDAPTEGSVILKIDLCR